MKRWTGCTHWLWKPLCSCTSATSTLYPAGRPGTFSSNDAASVLDWEPTYSRVPCRSLILQVLKLGSVTDLAVPIRAIMSRSEVLIKPSSGAYVKVINLPAYAYACDCDPSPVYMFGRCKRVGSDSKSASSWHELVKGSWRHDQA